MSVFFRADTKYERSKMKRVCKVQRCEAAASGYGVYCPKHKANDRRHGAPTQKGITKSNLKPYREMVSQRVLKNAENPVWRKAEERWLTVVRLAEGVIGRFASGRPGFAWERRAAVEVVKLSQHVAAREIVETTLAVYLMQDLEPRRFCSERAFRTQLVRRVRGLAEVNSGKWLDPGSGKVRRVYDELPPKVTDAIAEWVVAALGGIGVYLAKLESEKARKEEQEAMELAEALEGVQ
ncbi:hypothetical protein [Pseudorhodoplanes sp.]|uniref:hypothetical protein n=1 Tax=Pseudorhodoplanes sp. TaxID=1934341 RepID=UPI003D10CCDD